MSTAIKTKYGQIIGVHIYSTYITVEIRISREKAERQYSRHHRAGRAHPPLSSNKYGYRSTTYITYEAFIQMIATDMLLNDVVIINVSMCDGTLPSVVLNWILSKHNIEVFTSSHHMINDTGNLSNIIINNTNLWSLNLVCSSNTIDMLMLYGNNTIKYTLAWHTCTSPITQYLKLVTHLKLSFINVYSCEYVADTLRHRHEIYNAEVTDPSFGITIHYEFENDKVVDLFKNIGCDIYICNVCVGADTNIASNSGFCNELFAQYDVYFKDNWTTEFDEAY